MNFKTAKRVLYARNTIIQTIQIIVGTLLMAMATSLFLLPNKLSTGGFSGIATITYYLFKIPLGVSVLVLNIPLFIISYIKNGKFFFINAVFGTTMLSVFLDFFEKFGSVTNDKLLSCIYGGTISGIGSAIILKAGASTRWYRFTGTNCKSIQKEY